MVLDVRARNCELKMLKDDVEKQKINTRDSNVVPHRSTNLAR